MTTHELTDDGTLDTVLTCTDCGAESRYNYEPTEEGTKGLGAYQEFVRWAAADADERHHCPCQACGAIDYGDGPDHRKECPRLEADGHGHQGWVIIDLSSGATMSTRATGYRVLYQDLEEAREAAAGMRAGDELHAGNADIYVYALAPVRAECRRCGSSLANGRCTDLTCPYSDREQHEGWTEE
ncbi:MAG: hypothetical protein V3R71_06105 [Gemmatimonadales bacterium]